MSGPLCAHDKEMGRAFALPLSHSQKGGVTCFNSL